MLTIINYLGGATNAKGEKNMKTVTIKNATINHAYYGGTNFTREKKFRLTVTTDKYFIDDDVRKEFSESDLVPNWLNSEENEINIHLSSSFDFPVKMPKGDVITFAEFIESGKRIDVKADIKINFKDGASYPVALVISDIGTIYNPFEDME